MCARSSLCLHMWRSSDPLLVFCFFFLSALIREIPRSFLFPTIHHGLLSGCTRGKEVLGCEAPVIPFNPLSSLFSPSLLLSWPQFICSHEVKFHNTTFFSVVNLHVWEQRSDPLCDIEPCSLLCCVGARSSRHMIGSRSGWAGLNYRRRTSLQQKSSLDAWMTDTDVPQRNAALDFMLTQRQGFPHEDYRSLWLLCVHSHKSTINFWL